MTAPAADRASGSQDPVDTFLDTHYRLHPVTASFTGVRAYDAHMPDWSPEGLDAAHAELLEVAAAVSAAEPEPTSDPSTWSARTLDIALARSILDVQLAELESEHFHRGNPALHTGEAIFGAVSLLLADGVPAEERASALAERLHRVSEFLMHSARTLASRVVPGLWIERARRECAAGARLCSNGIPQWAADRQLPSALARRVERGAAAANAGFAQFATGLEQQPTAASGRASCGPDLLDLLLQRGHWSRGPALEMLEAAEREYEEGREQFACDANEAGGWPEVQERLAANHSPPDGYLDRFSGLWRACHDACLEHDLVTWPDFPISYEDLPPWARDVAPDLYFLHYRSPPPLAFPPVVRYFVPPLPADPATPPTPDHVIKLNHVIHHGALGHHVQNFHAARAPSRVARISAVDAASRISLYCGGTMAEGWACYAVDLMEEIGFLTADERIAHQHGRLRQLARAIVDLRLHLGHMDETAAVAFYTEDGAFPDAAAARAEVTRNTMFPGTGLMYWLGTSAIHELRSTLSMQPTFTLRGFHDTLLSHGSVPLPLIASLMAPASS